jgi:hypothetical protein
MVTQVCISENVFLVKTDHLDKRKVPSPPPPLYSLWAEIKTRKQNLNIWQKQAQTQEKACARSILRLDCFEETFPAFAPMTKNNGIKSRLEKTKIQ